MDKYRGGTFMRIKRNLFMVLKGRHIAIAGLGLIAVVTFIVLSRPYYQSASKPVRELPVYSVDRTERWVALTFDAAWGNEDTQQLIDILAQYNARCTFFIVGDWARKYPESVKALHGAGHEIMSHSDKHKHMNAMPAADIRSDLEA